jgi:hypothetical protein
MVDMIPRDAQRQDAGAEETGRVGKSITLAPSFQGAPRFQHERFQNALALARAYRRPTLFITHTCNTD